MCDQSSWNSLELFKLIVSAATPIAVVGIGLWVSRHLKRLEHLQWANQKAVEKRLTVYSELAPVLNDLYCYYDYIGDWKMADPLKLLSLKRTADRIFFVNAALFSAAFRNGYHQFMNLYFIPGPLDVYDATAKIRTSLEIRKEMYAKRKVQWDTAWDTYFAQSNMVPERELIVTSYRNLMDTFVQELGVRLKDAR